MPAQQESSLARHLREAKKRGLSQRAIAEILDVTDGTISNWKSGLRNVSAVQAMALARILGTTVEELLGPDGR